jgi:hypothetical protein
VLLNFGVRLEFASLLDESELLQAPLVANDNIWSGREETSQ